MQEKIIPFAADADLENARKLAEKFAMSGVLVKQVGKDVLECLDLGGLPLSLYDKLARICNNKVVDHKRNVLMAKEMSNSLFDCVITPSK